MGNKNKNEEVEIIRNYEFEKICRLEQADLKLYLLMKLMEFGYEIINEDGFLYAKGTEPVMLLAHMDTVHKSPVKDIQYYKDSSRILSPQGIGGDDRCGIYMILEIIKEHKCSVLFTEDEEIGCVGAKKFAATEYVKNLGVNYMIEFDRKGKNDAVFYSCDNPEFTKFITSGTGLIKSYGSCSDISKVAPASKIAAVNLSCGYYNAHTVTEYVVFAEMYNVIKIAKEIIQKECTTPFEYIETKSTYNYNGRYNDYDYDYYGSGYYQKGSYGEKLYRKNNQKSFVLEFLIYLEGNDETSNETPQEEILEIIEENEISEEKCDTDIIQEEDAETFNSSSIVTVYTIIEALTEDEAVGMFFKKFQQHCYGDIVEIYIGSKCKNKDTIYIDSLFEEEKPPITFVVGDSVKYVSSQSYQYLYDNGKIMSINEKDRTAVCAFGASGYLVKQVDIDDLIKLEAPLFKVGDMVKIINTDDITDNRMKNGDVLKIETIYSCGATLEDPITKKRTYCNFEGMEIYKEEEKEIESNSAQENSVEEKKHENSFYLIGDKVSYIYLETLREGTICETNETGAIITEPDGAKIFKKYQEIELVLQ